MRFILALILLISTSGCGMLKSSRDSSYVKQQRALNLDPRHIYSCGPEAVQKVLLRFGIESDLKNLSHAIQSSPSCANLLKDVVSIFDARGRSITFPSEVKDLLKKHGLKIVHIRSLEDLNKDKDTAIILIKQKNIINYHWVCFPTDKNIKTFFGKDTIIKEIYLIKR